MGKRENCQIRFYSDSDDLIRFEDGSCQNDFDSIRDSEDKVIRKEHIARQLYDIDHMNLKDSTKFFGIVDENYVKNWKNRVY